MQIKNIKEFEKKYEELKTTTRNLGQLVVDICEELKIPMKTINHCGYRYLMEFDDGFYIFDPNNRNQEGIKKLSVKDILFLKTAVENFKPKIEMMERALEDNKLRLLFISK